jgi:hypothetical protein
MIGTKKNAGSCRQKFSYIKVRTIEKITSVLSFFYIFVMSLVYTKQELEQRKKQKYKKEVEAKNSKYKKEVEAKNSNVRTQSKFKNINPPFGGG